MADSRRWGVLVSAWTVLAVGTLLTGCNGTYQVDEVNAFLATARPPVAGAQYIVMPPDQLAIQSAMIPEISGQSVRVRPDGKINLPLLGEVYVAGKSPLEIEQELVQLARRYYRPDAGELDATVQVVAYNSQRYYVFGQTGQRGPMAWTGNDTLLDVLTQVGLTEYAWPERVVIIRAEGPQRGGFTLPQSERYRRSGVHPEPEEAPRHIMTINLMAMVAHGDLSNNVLLQPNDIVYVQPNPFGRVALGIRRLLLPINPITEALTAPVRVASAATVFD